MMIYIISDDQYFLLGALSLLHQAQLPARALEAHQFGNNTAPVNSQDTLLVAVHSAQELERICRSLTLYNKKILFFVGINLMGHSTVMDGQLLPRNIKHPAFLKEIRRVSTRTTKSLSRMTNADRNFLYSLATGKSIPAVAKHFNMPLKTAYAKKRYLIQRMGIDRIHARSLLFCYSLSLLRT